MEMMEYTSNAEQFLGPKEPPTGTCFSSHLATHWTFLYIVFMYKVNTQSFMYSIR